MMLYLFGVITGLWICSLIALFVEMRGAPLIEDDYELPVIRPTWGDIE